MGSTSFREAPTLVSTLLKNSVTCSNAVTAQKSTNSGLGDLASELRSQQRIKMKRRRLKTSENSIEYILTEEDVDMESDCVMADDSFIYEFDDADEKDSKSAALRQEDPEWDVDSNSSSTESSSDSSYSPTDCSICAACGRGPFRTMKLHLLHCTGMKIKYFSCFLCKENFQTEETLRNHFISLYACHACGQVFSQKDSYQQHQCPKGSSSPLVIFCSGAMPPACKICKSFFTSDKTFLDHVTNVHTSVVSKVCIITNPSAPTDKNMPAGVRGTAAQSATISPNVVNEVINGKPRAGQTYTRPSILLSSSSSRHGRPPSSSHMMCSAASFGAGNDGLSGLADVPPGATDTWTTTVASDPVPAPVPTIMAMFRNDSQEVSLTNRMKTAWRSKAPFPCRQCGAILRQPSLIIRHRYHHRGSRSHQCECGRAFKHQLHLLRHCVQHAESISYICVSCGDTFTGAKLLAMHMRGKSRKSCAWRTRKRKVKGKCKMAFTCDCGQQFVRPSAYIWHQLKNRKKTKQLKKHL